METDLKLSKFQEKVLAIPQQWDIALTGGRGGGKSFLLALLALRYSELYQEKARILYIRKSHKSLADFEALTRELFGKIYGQKASYNATEHFWRLPNNSYFELGQMADDRDYLKFQGRSFGLLLLDEVTQYSTPQLLDKLRSNLRGPKEIPVRAVYSGNPGNVGHMWVAKRFCFTDAAPFMPFYEEQSGRTFVTCPSTFKDNPFINQDEYEKQLDAALATDEELLKAWKYGDWAVNRGAYFASVLEEKRNATDPWQEIPLNRFTGKKWRHWLAHDYGSSAPSVTYVMAESPGAEGPDGIYYPKDSIILVDELATADPNALNEGLGYTIPHLAELINELCNRWDIRAEGCADDACFANLRADNSIADEFRKEDVYFRKARKGSRKTGWEKMRTMLQNAGKPDKPGLYISRKCAYFWDTVQYIGRDKRDPEDLDTDGRDHGADACRYGLLYERNTVTTAKLKGW